MSTSVALVGRLTRDPELRNTPSGVDIANMRLAVDRAGDKQDDGTYAAGFFDIVAFGKQAELAGLYLVKGSQVGVFGSLRFHEWEAKDGSGKRSKVEVNVDRITFVGSKADREAGESPPAGTSDADFQGADDDIPF